MSNSNKYVKYGKIGYLLKHNFDMFFNKDYNDLMMYLIYLNNYNEDLLSLSKYVKEKKINKCTIVENKTPIIKKMYYLPHILDKPVKNTVSLNNNLLITGPNASGKTTLIKSVLINLFLSQSIGFGCYSNCKTKIYDYFHSYLNIPDTSNRDSLFQAESRRCKEILDIIHDTDCDTRHFCIFDELYSGTNPVDASNAGNAFIQYLQQYNNVNFILTTHYTSICKKYKNHKRVQNYKMDVIIDENDNYTYTYKLKKGISNIKGARRVLKDLNYPEQIIQKMQ